MCHHFLKNTTEKALGLGALRSCISHKVAFISDGEWIEVSKSLSSLLIVDGKRSFKLSTINGLSIEKINLN